MGHLRHLWFVVLFVISVNDVILRWRHWSSSLIFYCIENTTCYKFYFIIDCQKGLQSRRSTANDKTSLRRCFSPFLFLNSNAWKCQGGAFRFNWSSCCIFSLRYFSLPFVSDTNWIPIRWRNYVIGTNFHFRTMYFNTSFYMTSPPTLNTSLLTKPKLSSPICMYFQTQFFYIWNSKSKQNGLKTWFIELHFCATWHFVGFLQEFFHTRNVKIRQCYFCIFGKAVTNTAFVRSTM